MVADTRVSELIRENLNRTYATADPVRLLQNIRRGQKRLVAIADMPGTPADTVGSSSLDDFLIGLRTAWERGVVRPTAQGKAKQQRERRRPDPLVAITPQLELWFKAENLANRLRISRQASGEIPRAISAFANSDASTPPKNMARSACAPNGLWSGRGY